MGGGRRDGGISSCEVAYMVLGASVKGKSQVSLAVVLVVILEPNTGGGLDSPNDGERGSDAGRGGTDDAGGGGGGIARATALSSSLAT